MLRHSRLILPLTFSLLASALGQELDPTELLNQRQGWADSIKTELSLASTPEAKPLVSVLPLTVSLGDTQLERTFCEEASQALWRGSAGVSQALEDALRPWGVAREAAVRIGEVRGTQSLVVDSPSALDPQQGRELLRAGWSGDLPAPAGSPQLSFVRRSHRSLVARLNVGPQALFGVHFMFDSRSTPGALEQIRLVAKRRFENDFPELDLAELDGGRGRVALFRIVSFDPDGPAVVCFLANGYEEKPSPDDRYVEIPANPRQGLLVIADSLEEIEELKELHATVFPTPALQLPATLGAADSIPSSGN